MLKRIYILLLVLLPMAVMAQSKITINGYIEDAASGERLIGASVYDTISHKGAVTNTSGFYSLTLQAKTKPLSGSPQRERDYAASGDEGSAAGEAVLVVSYVGYKASRPIRIRLTSDTLINLSLQSNTRLDEIVVTGHQSISGPESVQMSAIEVPVSQLKAIPALAGEVDILKALQLMPGVQSGSEGTTGLYIRGGGPDENLILLDGVPLYSVNHLMGFFSVFNADAIKNVTLYKGNFPAAFGGRLSGVIDVRQNDGNIYAYHGNVTVGLLSAKANVEGYIPHKKDSTGTTTFNVSARRTYFDLFTSPLIGLATTFMGESMAPGAYFYDVNAKLTHTFANQNDKLSGSFYMGDDVMYMNMSYRENWEGNLYREKMNMRMTWGNILAAVNWEHRFTPRLFANTQVSYTRYRYSVKNGYSYKERENEMVAEENFSMQYSSSIRDVMAQTNFDYTPVYNNTLRFGAEYTYHQFDPNVSSVLEFVVDPNHPENNIDMKNEKTGGRQMGHEAAIYAEDTYSPWKWLKLNLGVRGSLYHIDGKTYPSIEPRAGLRALLYKDLSFKASYSYTTQYVHMLSNTSVSLPTDLWVPVTKNIAPMHSMIAAAGLSYNIMNQCELSVEGYYKRSKNLMEYRDGANFYGSMESWEEKVALGDGWSYGVELLLQRKVGPVTGWIGYTWSRTMRQFDREGNVLNFGKPFRAKYDREHDLSITLQYDINKRVDVAATFVYGTGTRATFGTQDYYDPIVGAEINHITERNNYKMPDYHRLDLGVNVHFPHKYSTWGQSEPTRRQQRKIWNRPAVKEEHQRIYESGKYGWCSDAEHVLSISVYNAYCHANPYMLIPEEGRLRQISLFPILPSISYTFKF